MYYTAHHLPRATSHFLILRFEALGSVGDQQHLFALARQMAGLPSPESIFKTPGPDSVTTGPPTSFEYHGNHHRDCGGYKTHGDPQNA